MLCALCAAAACSTTGGQRSAGGAADPHYKVGKPYQVNGRWYRPEENTGYDKVGVASWYGDDFHGRRTANGEIFDMNRLSAAHTTLPMPSMVEVTNLENGRRTVVRVNDRGPFAGDRLIDLSREAARDLGFERQGLAKVRVRYLGRASLSAAAPRRGERPRFASAAPETRKKKDAVTSRPQAIAPAPSAPLIENEAPDPEATIILAAMAAPEAAGEPAPAIASPEVTEAAPGPAAAPEPAGPDAETNASLATTPGAEPPASVEALYVVRVASLSKLDNIERLKRELEEIGPLRVARIELADARVFYRINMGPFSTIQTAISRLEAVRARGYHDASMVTLSP